MQVKRAFMLLIIFAILLSLLSGLYVSAGVAGVIDGEITVDNGKVTLSGPIGVNNQQDAMGNVISKYKDVITFISGLLAITSVGVFIMYFLRLGKISDNPRERTETITGLVISGLSASLLGSVTMIVGLFYGLLK